MPETFCIYNLAHSNFQVTTETATSAFSLPPALPPKDLQTFAMLQDLSSKRERTRNSHTLPATQLQRITMKVLLKTNIG